MRVLLCGARGFIGRHVQQVLQAAGHEVTGAGSSQQPGLMSVDFSHDTDVARWLPRVRGFDAVVNAVGVLRDSQARPLQAVHEDAPKALFDACALAGVRRVVQISALGIEGNGTHYARTKLAADAHLLALTDAGRVDGVVLRPSIVFGREGDSSRLFMGLARSPWLLLPRPVIEAQVQPVVVDDLAMAVAALLQGDGLARTGVLPCVGPAPLQLGAFIASLRAQWGLGPARVAPLPGLVTRLSARMGDALPFAPWCSETLALLAQDNVGPAEVLAGLLGRPALPHQRMVEASWQ